MEINGIPYDSIEERFMEEDSELSYIVRSLPPEERRLLILYAEVRSYRKIAKIYNMSFSTICKQVNRIKKKVIIKINQNEKNL